MTGYSGGHVGHVELMWGSHTVAGSGGGGAVPAGGGGAAELAGSF